MPWDWILRRQPESRLSYRYDSGRHHQLLAKQEEHDRQHDAVDGKDDKAVTAHPHQEPLDDQERNDERHGEADEENDPAMTGYDQGSDGLCHIGVFRMQGTEQIVAGGGDHGWDGDQEAELEYSRARHADDLPGGDGRHGTRGAGEDRGRDLAEADPDGLPQRHVFHVFRG